MRMRFNFFFAFYCSLTDVLTTWGAISLGAFETNPIAIFVISQIGLSLGLTVMCAIRTALFFILLIAVDTLLIRASKETNTPTFRTMIFSIIFVVSLYPTMVNMCNMWIKLSGVLG